MTAICEETSLTCALRLLIKRRNSHLRRCRAEVGAVDGKVTRRTTEQVCLRAVGGPSANASDLLSGCRARLPTIIWKAGGRQGVGNGNHLVSGLRLCFAGLAKKFSVMTFVNPSLGNKGQIRICALSLSCCGNRGASQEQTLPRGLHRAPSQGGP